MTNVECQLIDEEQRLEAEEEYEEYHGFWHGMSKELLDRWAKEYMNEVGSGIFMEKFMQTKPLPDPKPGDTIKFRRYNNHMQDALAYGTGILKSNCPKFEK